MIQEFTVDTVPCTFNTVRLTFTCPSDKRFEKILNGTPRTALAGGFSISGSMVAFVKTMFGAQFDETDFPEPKFNPNVQY